MITAYNKGLLIIDYLRESGEHALNIAMDCGCMFTFNVTDKKDSLPLKNLLNVNMVSMLYCMRRI